MEKWCKYEIAISFKSMLCHGTLLGNILYDDDKCCMYAF